MEKSKLQSKIKNLIKLDDVKSVMQFLQQPTVKIAEALTGILASDSKDWKLSAGKIVQAAIKGNLLTQLGREIEKYREEGKIKEDYLENDINRASFKELLKFIDEETPDEIRFKAMKSIFLSSIEKSSTAEQEMLAYQMLQVAKQLSSEEILILLANFNIVKGKSKPTERGIDWSRQHTNIRDWAQTIAGQVGHNLSDLVLQYEQHLISLRIISDRHYPIDTTRITDNFEPTSYYRLTDLGYKLCEFIIKYDQLPNKKLGK